MNRNILAYLFVMSLVSFIIRVLPVTLILGRSKIALSAHCFFTCPMQLWQ